MTLHSTQTGAALRSLKGDRAFKRLRKGRPGHAKFLSLRYQPTRTGYVRVGIVVTKKVGNAVTRNRLRRRVREALRALLGEKRSSVTFAGRASFDLVIIVKPEAVEATYAQLKAALERALKRSGVFA